MSESILRLLKVFMILGVGLSFFGPVAASGAETKITADVTISLPAEYGAALDIIKDYKKKKDYTNALKIGSYLIRVYPNIPEAFYELSSIHLILGNFHKALFSINKAIELTPKNADYYIQRGRVYGAMPENQELKALKDFFYALGLSPRAYVAYEEIGDLYYKMETYDKSVKAYSVFLSFKNEELTYEVDKQPRLGVLKKRGYAFLKQQCYADAIKDLDQIIKESSSDYEAYGLRGRAYKELQLFPHALEDFTKALEFGKPTYELYIMRGEIYRAMGKEWEARLDFDKAAALNNGMSSRSM